MNNQQLSNLKHINNQLELKHANAALLKNQLEYCEMEIEELNRQKQQILEEKCGIKIGAELLVIDEFLQLPNVQLYPSFYHKDMNLYLSSIWENGTCVVSDENPLGKTGFSCIGGISIDVVLRMRRAYLSGKELNTNVK